VECVGTLEFGKNFIINKRKNAPTYAIEKYNNRIEFYTLAISNIKINFKEHKEFYGKNFEF
jgi:hypothetical protein